MIEPKGNKVISKFTAIINGSSTGLAGCVRECKGCIRGDSELNKSADFSNSEDKSCRYRIPY
ncbi:hypothetical protein [Neptuniibacter sp. QD37_11]|uniref:hypothetical protein n=1 Tax=Neptuniibacter sp. QD37_11 TaxID=3398209 RepID=UPI0039F46251